LEKPATIFRALPIRSTKQIVWVCCTGNISQLFEKRFCITFGYVAPALRNTWIVLFSWATNFVEVLTDFVLIKFQQHIREVTRLNWSVAKKEIFTLKTFVRSQTEILPNLHKACSVVLSLQQLTIFPVLNTRQGNMTPRAWWTTRQSHQRFNQSFGTFRRTQYLREEVTLKCECTSCHPAGEFA